MHFAVKIAAHKSLPSSACGGHATMAPLFSPLRLTTCSRRRRELHFWPIFLAPYPAAAAAAASWHGIIEQLQLKKALSCCGWAN